MIENSRTYRNRKALERGMDGNSVRARMKEQEFEGVIPPIAEKEKRGKRIKRVKDEAYVRELSQRDSINIPAAN